LSDPICDTGTPRPQETERETGACRKGAGGFGTGFADGLMVFLV
jgi:hypothetical protein